MRLGLYGEPSPRSRERVESGLCSPRVYRELADYDRLSRRDRLRSSFHLRARVRLDAVRCDAKASRRLVDLELRPAVCVNGNVVSNLQPRGYRGTVQAERIVAERPDLSVNEEFEEVVFVVRYVVAVVAYGKTVVEPDLCRSEKTELRGKVDDGRTEWSVKRNRSR